VTAFTDAEPRATWRDQLQTVIGPALVGIGVGAVMGIVWWWIAPTERWIKGEDGLGPQQLTSPAWFAADGWFLILGVIAGLILTTLAWFWWRSRPIALVVGVLLGGSLLAAVAWALGGILGPPDPNGAASSLAVGATVDGSLGLRAMGVLAAPLVSALALLSLLLSTATIRPDEHLVVPDQSRETTAS
jgi:hypothetical protein